MIEILLLFALTVLNGVFAMSELAVISARKQRLQNLVDEGNTAAEKALSLAENPNQFLSTVQIGITLVGILLGTLGGATIADNVAKWLNVGQSVALTIVVVVTTYLSLVVGELVPKRLALRNPEQIAMALARPIGWLSLVTRPVVWILSLSSDMAVRLMGMRPIDTPSVNERDILSMIRQGIPEGVFDEDEHEMVEAVFRLDDQPAKGIITPRTDIIWLDVDATDEDIRTVITEASFSAYPVCRESVDDVIGLVRLQDLVKSFIAPGAVNLTAIMQKPLFVPENVPSGKILERFKASGIHTALIIDEYGGIKGLVTLHDMLEAFVGEIDPKDPEAVMRDDGSWLIDGRLPIHRVIDIFPDFSVPEEEGGEYESIAGFMLKRLDHIPEAGEHLVWEDIYFEVVDMDNQRIDKVLMKAADTDT